MQRTPRRVRTVVLSLALAVFAVACGSDAPSSEFASTDGPLEQHCGATVDDGQAAHVRRGNAHVVERVNTASTSAQWPGTSGANTLATVSPPYA